MTNPYDCLTNPDIYVGKSEIHGYGVFCGSPVGFKKGILTERCFGFFLENPKWDDCDKSLLKFCFGVPFLQENAAAFAKKHGGGTIAHITRPFVATGNAMLYNHSKNPNVSWTFEERTSCLLFRTLRKVEEGEELVIKYNDYVEFDLTNGEEKSKL